MTASTFTTAMRLATQTTLTSWFGYQKPTAGGVCGLGSMLHVQPFALISNAERNVDPSEGSG